MTAMLHRPDGSWFIRLSGDTSVVKAQKQNFIEFLKSIRIQEVAAQGTASADEAGSPRPTGRCRSNGKASRRPDATGQVRRGTWHGEGRGFRERLSTDTGGTLANVNRWRRQVGLGEAGQADLTKLIAPLTPPIRRPSWSI